MRRRTTLLLNLALILSLAFSGTLSGLLIPTPVATGTSSVPVVAPGESSPDLSSRRVKRHRRHDRAQKDRQQDRKQKDRKAGRKQKDKKQDRKKDRNTGEQVTGQGRVGDWQDQCAGPNMVRLSKTELCTHGPDPAPSAFALDRADDSSSAPEVEQLAPIVCESDGETGFRVQVLYVRGSSSPALSAGLLANIRARVGEMDQIFHDSAVENGNPPRNVRFVQDPVSPCQVGVADVVVTTSALNDFDTMIAQLADKGYDEADRIYLSFVNARTYCGIGTLWGDDDSDGTANWNNFGPSYSRVDAGCWVGWVAAHEVMHNLGGVQLSAKNSSGGFHCIDEYDIMCYSDAGEGVPQMQDVCKDVALNTTRFDCNDDDYYNTNPAPDSDLTKYWNPANNRFLIGAPVTEVPEGYEPPRVKWTKPVGNNQQFAVSAGQIALEAGATDDKGVVRVEFWRYDNEGEDWEIISEDDTAPYESSIDAGALSPGANYLSADAYDTSGRFDYELIVLAKASPTVSEPPPPPPPTTTNNNDKKKDKKDKKKKKGKHKKRKRR
ncbi:MAG TPA: Ig-like domain-containing protein [Gemmatimonadales bacterium]|nr:Ig-like domain-containing protein [Gemmatimonadales bacterium]